MGWGYLLLDRLALITPPRMKVGGVYKSVIGIYKSESKQQYLTARSAAKKDNPITKL